MILGIPICTGIHTIRSSGEQVFMPALGVGIVGITAGAGTTGVGTVAGAGIPVLVGIIGVMAVAGTTGVGMVVGAGTVLTGMAITTVIGMVSTMD
jgi:hypothetical protein